ncbi:DUF817 domain-containing protein [Candidatus Nomurabacteria bacterium]|nr:DUF817 domain-containing protein [Candidatus Nomurabacteria bacterium]
MKSTIKSSIKEIFFFGLKQADASIFGICMIVALIFTAYVDIPFIARYDFLFLFAVLIQIFLISFRFEYKEEVLVILVFHILALAMEFFKTSANIGSWTYPESGFFMIATVPLFAGFLYASVGSYIARAWRIFSLSFSKYPPMIYTITLAFFSYINFITHHFIYDIRWFLFLFSAVIFWKTRVNFIISKKKHSMPLLVGLLLISLFIWIAENIGTLTSVWLYPHQYIHWELVSFSKIGSWYLLMMVSFTLVSLIYKGTLRRESTPTIENHPQ